jgi:hypothetical protein
MPRVLSLRAPRAAGVLVSLLAARSASAQVNTDVGLSVGAMKRFTTSVPDGVSQPGFGPAADVRAHVAVLPMLRVGLYAAYDLSPVPGAPARSFFTGGLHVKVSPPLLPAPWKTYLFTGFGAGYVVRSGSDASTGGVLEVPVGLGLTRRVSPLWEPFIELGGRFGVASFGPMYEASHAGFVGTDSFALSLTVGVSLTP